MGSSKPDEITSLPRITLDFTNRGPGLLSGLRQATNVLDVKVTGSIVPVVIADAGRLQGPHVDQALSRGSLELRFRDADDLDR